MKLIIDLTSKESTLHVSSELKLPLTSPQLLSVLNDSGLLSSALSKSLRGTEEDVPKKVIVPPRRVHQKKSSKKSSNMTSLTTLPTSQRIAAKNRQAEKFPRKPRKNPTLPDPDSVSGNVRRVILEVLSTSDKPMVSGEINRLVQESYPEVKKHNPPFVYYILGRMSASKQILRTGSQMHYRYQLNKS